MLSRYLIICFLLVSAAVYSQEPQVNGKSLLIDHIRFFFGVDPGNGDLLVFTDSQYYAFNPGKDTAWRSIRYKRNDLTPFINYPEEIRFVPNNRECLFFRDGGGIVYMYKDSSLLRVDSSFLHRNQFGGAFFSYRDRIFHYGGYGFFMYKGYMTEFSLENPQWFIFYYDKKSRIPGARSHSLYQFDTRNGKFYISGGVVNTNPSIYRSENKSYKDVWELDMASRKWRKLGLMTAFESIPMTDNLFFSEKYTYLTYPDKERNFCRVCIGENRLDCFESKEKINQAIEYRFRGAYSPINQHFVLAKKRNGDVREQLSIEAIPRGDLEYNATLSQRYYLPWWEMLLLVGVVPLLLLIGGYFLFRYINKALKRKRGQVPQYTLSIEEANGQLSLIYEGVPIFFEEDHRGLLQLFFMNEGRLSNQDMLDYVRNGLESHEVLKKRKIRLIREINDIFKYTTRLEDSFLEELPDPVDRRFKEYRIRPDYMEAIRKKTE